MLLCFYYWFHRSFFGLWFHRSNTVFLMYLYDFDDCFYLLLLSKGVAWPWPLFLLILWLDPPPVVLDLKSFSIRLVQDFKYLSDSLCIYLLLMILFILMFVALFCLIIWFLKWLFVFIYGGLVRFMYFVFSYMILSNQWSWGYFLLNLSLFLLWLCIYLYHVSFS